MFIQQINVEEWEHPTGTPEKLVLKVKKLSPTAILPVYATDGAGCFDLFADSFAGQTGSLLDCEDIPAFGLTIGTGIAVEVPEGYVMLIFSRSGHGFKQGVRLANCVGVIDSDYRGEVKVKLVTDLPDPFKVAGGSRIAQGMLVKIPTVSIKEVYELSSTDRGVGGFGSTGGLI